MKKYKIEDCLENLTMKEYKKVVAIIPTVINKSINTFWNYSKIEENSEQDIPYCVVIVLERFFKLSPGEMCNIKIEVQEYDKYKYPDS